MFSFLPVHSKAVMHSTGAADAAQNVGQITCYDRCRKRHRPLLTASVLALEAGALTISVRQPCMAHTPYLKSSLSPSSDSLSVTGVDKYAPMLLRRCTTSERLPADSEYDQ